MKKEDEYYAERKAEDEEERRKIEDMYSGPEKENIMKEVYGKELMPEVTEKCYCGGTGEIRFSDYPMRPGAIGFEIQCKECKWTTPTCDTPELAALKWHERRQDQTSKHGKPQGPYGKYEELKEMNMQMDPKQKEPAAEKQSGIEAINECAIEGCIKLELERANHLWPQFASTHEGWAVIKEEVEEALEDTHAMKHETAFLFEKIREHHAYDTFKENIVGDIRYRAVQAIKELVQVAAMCDKFRVLGKDAQQKHIDDIIDKSATVEKFKAYEAQLVKDECGAPVNFIHDNMKELAIKIVKEGKPTMGNPTLEEFDEFIKDPHNSKIGRDIDEAGRKARGEK